nr:ribonuclease H-like domain, reverse transcriptase, RNA-dependent DNA polymerase [Tanacetum cinerariifolium]
MKAIKKVLHYVKGTKDYGITYKHNGGNKIHGYNDSSYGVNTQEGKGTTGIIFYYRESPISWSTQKQATVALSSCESEFVIATAPATQALWLKRLLSRLTHSDEEKITILVDNKSAITLMKNPVFHGRSKHIDMKYHFIRECVKRDDIQVEFVTEDYQKADILTKALPKIRFLTMRQLIGLKDLQGTKLRALHLGITPNLETLKVNDCRNMVELRMPTECPKLVHLDIGKLKLRTLHLGITPNLKILRLKNCADMVELCMHAKYPKLVHLDIKRLKLRNLHHGITSNLETLRLEDCADMVELRVPAECPKLAYLELRNNAKLRALDVGLTSNLEMVAVENCTEMVELCMPADCPKLVTLYLYNLKLRTLHLGMIPNIKWLRVKDCRDLVEL